MIKGAQNNTRQALGQVETRFLALMGERADFTTADARKALTGRTRLHVSQFLAVLERKGWISRIRRGVYAVIPLSSGNERTPQMHEFLVAMRLVKPAAIAYWSALNHHGMTEQLPRTVFVATDHPVRRQPGNVLGIPFKLVAMKPEKFFGVVKAWIDEKPFSVTDREKTIVDGLDLPQYSGGVQEIAKALAGAWKDINRARLIRYAAKIGNAAVAKRLGFLLWALQLGDAEALMESVELSAGYSLLDPTVPARGPYNRRWRLRINVEVDK